MKIYFDTGDGWAQFEDKNSFLNEYKPTPRNREYPEGYTEKPNVRRRHPSGYESDYRYE